ncbi:MAG: hypothetical protein AB7F79_00630 [Steroidobacteraceae bacterium]
MKLIASFLPILAFFSASALAADVGVSISVGQPGFYGQIILGDFPQPRLVYPRSVIIQPARAGVVIEPVYLHVPPGHAKNWKKYCSRYSACGRPVYFVQESWYNDVYAPRYQEKHGKEYSKQGKGHGKSKGN